MTAIAASPAERTIRRLSVVALALVLLLFGVLGGLAATIRISGAVIAPGALVVSSYVKAIQHLKGGIVGSINVRNGDHVEAGQVLLHLDDTQTRANLAIIRKRLDELAARTARLAAELDDKPAIAFPASLVEKADDQEARDLMSGETRLFNDRLASRKGRKAQLRERIGQLNQEIDGLVAQQKGKQVEVDLVNKELASLQRLSDQGSVAATKVYDLQRESASVTAELGNIVSSIAQVHGKITETELQVIQVDDDKSSEVSEQLRQAQSDQGQFLERQIAAEDDLKRIDVRAPQSGIVDQLTVHSAGAVIGAGETIMRVVPDKDALIAELKLPPQDIDQVSLGQHVVLRLSAFNQRATPEINGDVKEISADLMTDQHSGQNYYIVRAAITPAEWSRLGRLSPVPGMPVEAFLQTGRRTVMAYLTKPLTDQMHRAFREE
jgi:HlyD family secretion protein